MPVGALKRFEDMIEFAYENQGNWSCRFATGADDPPVYSDALDVWQEPARGFQRICDSLDHFLITLSLQEAVYSSPYLITADASSVSEALSISAPPLWLDGFYVNARPSHNFYHIPEQDILIMDYAGIWIGGHSSRVTEIVGPSIACQLLNDPHRNAK